jgi:hypothetical protein
MNEPTRLSESSDALTRTLLRAGSNEAPADESLRSAAVALGLASAAGSGVAGGLGAAGAVPAAKGSGAWLATAIKWLAVGVASGAVVWGGWEISAPPEPAPIVLAPAVTEAPLAPATTPRSVPAKAADPREPMAASESAPAGRAAVAWSAPSAAAASPAPTPTNAASRKLSEEVALLEGARKALKDSSPERAIENLSAYRARSEKTGVLDPEAEILEIDALDQSGRTPRAAELARAFVARHPGSPHVARLNALIRRAGAPGDSHAP